MNEIIQKYSQESLYLPEFEHDNCGAGFICSLKGEKKNAIIELALELLANMEHRGAVSSDGKTGDGAGILIEIPHEFFKKVCPNISFPKPGDYAVGMVFLPLKENQRQYCESIFEKNLITSGLNVLGWRDVEVDKQHVGPIAAETEPFIRQIFVTKPDDMSDVIFKAKLYYARKITEKAILESGLSQKEYFYLPSFSTTTLIYKGLLKPEFIKPYFKDLNDIDLVTRFALVHQRFSTNTFPRWELAQPFRYMCHNGEINTLRGNVSRMRAREELLQSDIFTHEELKNLSPIIISGKSDSATMDMVVEFFLHTGRSLPEIMMMLIPEAWEHHQTMDEKKKAFYQYNSCIMEPWDGPASIPFTDGEYIGALLDRNGLRPSRYTVTKDDYVIMSSEVGCIPILPENVKMHGRLEPGKMFLVNMNEGKIISDEEIKSEIVQRNPYQEWIKNLTSFDALNEITPIEKTEKTNYYDRLVAFGYSKEDIEKLIKPMLTTGKEAIGSMGTDTPLAVFSKKNQLLYNYFKQLFAQVTNPPLDGIREQLVTDFSLAIGPDHNIFDISANHCKKLKLNNPVLSNEDISKIEQNTIPHLKAKKISILYPIISRFNGLEDRLDAIVNEIINSIDQGYKLFILSDRGIDKNSAPIPALLATSYIHHSLQRLQKRSEVGLIVETGEAREIHHFAMIFGYGASGINPYMVEDVIKDLYGKGEIEDKKNAFKNFQKAVEAGVIKVMNKIGISTLKSYRSSQIFEAIGISSKVMEKYFPYTTSRIEGLGMPGLEREIAYRHQEAFAIEREDLSDLDAGGNYQWRRNGEAHLFNPLTIAKLQESVRLNKPIAFKEYSTLINEQSKQTMTIRGLMEFDKFDPISIEEVEPWTEIVKRFKTGAMSFGSISQEAHENLAIAMNRLGGKSNSGEGGEDQKRFQKDSQGDWRNSAIKQVASGRFGVSINYLTNAQEIQIKMAQGAKPGEGGQLPADKVYPYVAECRNSTPYVGLISPPPHHDIYSIEDLSQLIYDLKNANREARINVKLVSEVGVGTIAAGVAKAKADVILISGYDGGTGASPLTSLRHTGLPWELGLAEAQQTLVMNDLRGRVVLECDGQLKTGRDVAIACLLGAEEFGFATAPLIASGCIMMRVCHLNTCPVGIATQDPELRKKFEGKPEHVINFFYYIAEELREIMAQLGFRTIDEMIGQVQKLKQTKNLDFYKLKGIDLSKILFSYENNENAVKNVTKQDHELQKSIDFELLSKSQMAILRKETMKFSMEVNNSHRSIGTILSNEIAKKYGDIGLPENTLMIDFKGSAGQSFGAFAANGLSLKIKGNTNDYLGKGLSGGKIIVQKPEEADFKSDENIIIGNVALYGAIKGQAYINGKAGERFAVRNSGAIAVVEGVGDHGCEYMTGGKVIILGKTGRNFAAGMSGGIAYVLNEDGKFEKNCNMESIELFPITDASDEKILKKYIHKHWLYTQSEKAKLILENWETYLPKFMKVYPPEYKAALERIAMEKKVERIKNKEVGILN